MKFTFASFFIFFFFPHSFAQFAPPMSPPLDLAGNFGELRPGHFHMGLDIRTNGSEGLKVFSIESGYISRISLNTKGYGQVLYITHPTGHTSVYAHLSDFAPFIKSHVRSWQYARRSYVLDTLLPVDLLRVDKGQFIALSGNTGGSNGPHLHFEIRNTTTEKAINPMHFGYVLKNDKFPPELLTLAIYPLNALASVNGKNTPQYFQLRFENGFYILTSPPKVYGKVGFGIACRDRVNGNGFSFAPYRIKLYKQGETVYEHRMDSLDFHHGRFVNTHMDYGEAIRSKRKIQKSFTGEFNDLQIYIHRINNGQLFFLGDSITKMQYEVYDFNGNRSVLNFTVLLGMPHQNTPSVPSGYAVSPADSTFICLADSSLLVRIPPKRIYETGFLPVIRRNMQPNGFFPVFDIGTLETPLHNFIGLEFNVGQMPKSLHPYLTVVSLDKKGKVLAAEPSQLSETWLLCSTRSLGSYTVLADSIPPSIGNITHAPSFADIAVSDNLSGITFWEAEVDGLWVVAEYHPNMKKIRVILEDLSEKPVQRRLVLHVKDARGNDANRAFIFYK